MFWEQSYPKNDPRTCCYCIFMLQSSHPYRDPVDVYYSFKGLWDTGLHTGLFRRKTRFIDCQKS